MGIDSLFFIFALPFFLLFLFSVLGLIFGENKGLIQIVVDNYHYFHEGAQRMGKSLKVNIVLFSISAKFILEVIDFIIIATTPKNDIKSFIERQIGENKYRRIILICGIIGFIIFLTSIIGSQFNKDGFMASMLQNEYQEVILDEGVIEEGYVFEE